jgi:hypothetical protein
LDFLHPIREDNRCAATALLIGPAIERSPLYGFLDVPAGLIALGFLDVPAGLIALGVLLCLYFLPALLGARAFPP